MFLIFSSNSEVKSEMSEEAAEAAEEEELSLMSIAADNKKRVSLWSLSRFIGSRFFGFPVYWEAQIHVQGAKDLLPPILHRNRRPLYRKIHIFDIFPLSPSGEFFSCLIDRRCFHRGEEGDSRQFGYASFKTQSHNLTSISGPEEDGFACHPDLPGLDHHFQGTFSLTVYLLCKPLTHWKCEKKSYWGCNTNLSFHHASDAQI